MGKIKEVVIEIQDLQKELEWYLEYEPTNHLKIEEIQKTIFMLEDKLNGVIND